MGEKGCSGSRDRDEVGRGILVALKIPVVCASTILARMPEWAGWFGTEVVLIKSPEEFLGGWDLVIAGGTKIAIVNIVVSTA